MRTRSEGRSDWSPAGALLVDDLSERLNGDRHRQDERVVVVRGDLDAVGVAHAEPLLRDLGNVAVIALYLILVVSEVTLDRPLVAGREVDLEAMADADETLMHLSDLLA